MMTSVVAARVMTMMPAVVAARMVTAPVTGKVPAAMTTVAAAMATVAARPPPRPPPPLPNDAPVTDVSATAMVTANIGTRFGFMVALPYRFQLGSRLQTVFDV